MTVHVDGNKIIPKVKVNIGLGFRDKNFSFGYFNNTMIQNRCEAYQLCDVIFEPNTEKRKVINKLMGLFNNTLMHDSSSLHSKALCDLITYIESIPDNKISYTMIQRFVLILFYHTTNGSQWLIDSFWLSDRSECQWYGISCNEYGVVINLNLSSNNLVGPIISEIGELRGLETLILDENRITGIIPKEIEKLGKLEILRISNNQLQKMIPTHLLQLHSLLELDLSYNNLSGNIPNDIAELKNLVKMNVSNNFLSDQLPNQICNLTKMTTLSLSNNLFVGNANRLSELLQLGMFKLVIIFIENSQYVL